MSESQGGCCTNPEAFVLAAMSQEGGKKYSPVQIQKLLFVLEKELRERINGPHFDFQPYDYGPFDKNVYSVLGELSTKGHVTISHGIGKRYPHYSLTLSGLEVGRDALSRYDTNAQAYIAQVSEFVLSCTFPELVAAIYKAYPEMRVNSVFKGR